MIHRPPTPFGCTRMTIETRDAPWYEGKGYSWPQARWCCSCGMHGQWGKHDGLTAKWEAHVKLLHRSHVCACGEKAT